MAWAVVGAAAITTIGGSLLAGDNGAEGANNAAADSTRLQSEIAQDQWNQYKRIYQPLEEQYVADAQNFDSPENYAKAAGSASATVASQFSKARDRLIRTPGLDPSSGAYQAGLTGLGLSEAATGAVAQNAARQGVKDQAYTMKTNALNLGKGLPGTASQGLGSVASSSMAQASAAQAQANGQAAALGQVTNRVLTSPSVSKWLNGGGSNVSNQSLSMANSTADPLGSLITTQGW